MGGPGTFLGSWNRDPCSRALGTLVRGRDGGREGCETRPRSLPTSCGARRGRAGLWSAGPLGQSPPWWGPGGTVQRRVGVWRGRRRGSGREGWTQTERSLGVLERQRLPRRSRTRPPCTWPSDPWTGLLCISWTFWLRTGGHSGVREAGLCSPGLPRGVRGCAAQGRTVPGPSMGCGVGGLSRAVLQSLEREEGALRGLRGVWGSETPSPGRQVNCGFHQRSSGLSHVRGTQGPLWGHLVLFYMGRAFEIPSQSPRSPFSG